MYGSSTATTVALELGARVYRRLYSGACPAGIALSWLSTVAVARLYVQPARYLSTLLHVPTRTTACTT